MERLLKISGPAAALLGLSLTAVVLFAHRLSLPLPLLLVIIIGLASICSSLLGLRSGQWRFKAYSTISLATWLCLAPFIADRAIARRPHRLRPVPPSVTIQGLSKSEAEQLYATVQDMSRQLRWRQLRRSISTGSFRNAWAVWSRGNWVITNMSRGTDGSVCVASVIGTNVSVTTIFKWQPPPDRQTIDTSRFVRTNQSVTVHPLKSNP